MNALSPDHHPLTRHRVPRPARVAKHALFGLLPGHIGMRNRACYHHLTKPRAEDHFTAALNRLAPGDICIDCGANRGEYTARMARKGARTYAFEPDPWSFERLAQNARALRDVHLINKAVGTTPGKIPFYRDAGFDTAPDLCSLASTVYPRSDRPQTRIEVEMIDFPAFLRDLDRDIAILKMDIEGAEVPLLEALFDAPDVMARIGALFVETHELQFPDLLARTWALRDRIGDFPGTVINLDWH